MVDQRRFDNQRGYLTAREATALLDVKLKTLYAYASRGLLRSVPGPDGRGHLYAREDLERLKARHDARSGHGPVAAGALAWGDPVLASAVSEIGPDGPRYRGWPATGLAARGVPFERVADLLIAGLPPDGPDEERGELDDGPRAPWPAPPALPLPLLAAAVPRGSHPVTALSIVVPLLGARDPHRAITTPEAEARRARGLLRALAALSGLGQAPLAEVRRALAAPTVGEAAALALGACGPGAGRASRGPRPTALSAIERVLVLLADHELNASTFAARVAASAGADLYACLSAGLATLSGPRHGGAIDRVEALLGELGTPRRVRAELGARLGRGEPLPGFGHPLYPDGDPRARPILAAARALRPIAPAARVFEALAAEVARAGGEPPNVDAALAAVGAALGLRPGGAAGLFAVARMAGWVAHVLEQRASPAGLLRPRARYVGPSRRTS